MSKFNEALVPEFVFASPKPASLFSGDSFTIVNYTKTHAATYV